MPDIEQLQAPRITWQRDETETRRETYYCGEKHGSRYGYLSRYESSDDYHWQDVRHGNRLGGIERGLDAAMAACEASIALTDEEFNTRVVADLRQDLARIEKQILAIAPDAAMLPGYHAGFAAGMAKMRDDVLAAVLVQ